MAAVTSEGVLGGRHRLAERLRAAVLGPRGGGTTRRRASDAFRLGLAVVASQNMSCSALARATHSTSSNSNSPASTGSAGSVPGPAGEP